jgi:purine-nucleoside phosphorylase
VGIILGSGLGSFADHIEDATTIRYTDIPHFADSTVIGHRGALVCGYAGGLPVVAMNGRFHRYEGHDMQRVTLPVRLMQSMGIELLVVSNASGGLNPSFNVGDIMIIEDHINLMFDNPLLGSNNEALGPRFPDMSAPYDPELITRALEQARRNNFVVHQGVYAALSGPTYETRAEYRMLRRLGADAVGMSTVPEVIVAVHGGTRVFAVSVIANVCKPDVLTPTDGAEVVAVAAGAEHKMRSLVFGILEHIA